MAHQYPLEMSFKIAALAPQIRITDSSGMLKYYVKQKLFKLKEAISVTADEEQTQLLYTISADRIIDWSASYNFADAMGSGLGAVRRKGTRSLWRAFYEIMPPGGDMPEFTITEESVMVRFLDGCMEGIPIVSMFAGYFFNPTYIVAAPDGTPVMRLSKQPAFFEGKFRIDLLAQIDEQTEMRILLSLMMMTLLERARG